MVWVQQTIQYALLVIFVHANLLAWETDCKWCHAADNQPDPTVPSNGPLGNAKDRTAGSCHLFSNLPNRPFHAPGNITFGDRL